MLLSVLFIIPMNAATDKNEKRKSRIRHLATMKKHVCRTSSEFNMLVRDEEDILTIQLQSPLSDAEITVTDKDGKTVIYEPQTFIYEDKLLYIYTPNAYPYTVEITSPTLDVKAEIVLEEY